MEVSNPSTVNEDSNARNICTIFTYTHEIIREGSIALSHVDSGSCIVPYHIVLDSWVCYLPEAAFPVQVDTCAESWFVTIPVFFYDVVGEVKVFAGGRSEYARAVVVKDVTIRNSTVITALIEVYSMASCYIRGGEIKHTCIVVNTAIVYCSIAWVQHGNSVVVLNGNAIVMNRAVFYPVVICIYYWHPITEVQDLQILYRHVFATRIFYSRKGRIGLRAPPLAHTMLP